MLPSVDPFIDDNAAIRSGKASPTAHACRPKIVRSLARAFPRWAAPPPVRMLRWCPRSGSGSSIGSCMTSAFMTGALLSTGLLWQFATHR